MFMKTHLNTFLFLLLFLLSGCVTLYKPNPVYSPLLKQQGEFNASAALGILGCGLWNLQGAYAITNNLGLTANGMYHTRGSSSNDSLGSYEEKLRIASAEIGAGYFKTFGSNEKGLFQCYGGGGYGLSSDRIYNAGSSNPEVSAKYFNIYAQPGIGFVDKNFEFAFDVRANYVQLFDISGYQYNMFEWWNTNFYDDTVSMLNFLNLEPNITIKAGGPNLKGVLQLGVTVPTLNSDAYFAVNSYSLLIVPLMKVTLGMSYTFGRKRADK
jgi:hypothetical protein